MAAGLTASFVQQILLVFAWSKTSALVALCIGSIGNLTFPAISTIKSLNVAESEQVPPPPPNPPPPHLSLLASLGASTFPEAAFLRRPYSTSLWCSAGQDAKRWPKMPKGGPRCQKVDKMPEGAVCCRGPFRGRSKALGLWLRGLAR